MKTLFAWIVVLGTIMLVIAGANPVSAENKIPPEIKAIAQTAQDLTGYYTGVTSAIETARKVGEALGIIKPDNANAKFDALHEHLTTVATGLSWQQAMACIDPQRGPAIGAIWALKDKRLDLTGDEPITRSSASTLGSATCPYYRPYDKNTDEPLMAILDYTKSDLDPQPGDMVYDWRLGIPALLEVISYRLQVIAAMDNNFRNDGKFNTELLGLRTDLESHYNKMLQGVRCGIKYSEKICDGLFGSCREVLVTTPYVCADIHTGHSAAGDGKCLWDEHSWSWNCPPSWNRPQTEEEILAELESEVKSAMPLYEMKAMIDTLYLYTQPQQMDLTEWKHCIPVYKAQSLCLDVQWGNAANGTPVWLWSCNGTNAQQWVYDRRHGTVMNPALGKCLEVTHEASAQSHGFPVSINDCYGDDWQQWIYDPKTQVLLNARGTVLDIQWGNLQQGTFVWTWPLNGSGAQRWYAPLD